MNTFERDIKLQCTSLAISPQEIQANIPDTVMTEVKNKYPTPYFRAYSIAHEGIAKPRFIGENASLPTKWSRNVIESLKGVVKRGVQFFVGHNADNSTNGRNSIGEVVANFQKQIGDKLHDIVIGIFPDKIIADQYDVCSMEGNVSGRDYDNYSIIDSVRNITGIALGNSAHDKPAFPGAVYLGSIQAFDVIDDSLPPKNISSERTMTFEEIKKAVKDMNIFPAQLYSEEDFKNDRIFGKMFDQIAEATKNASLYKSQLDEKETEVKKLQKNLSVSTAHEKLTKSLPEGLTDKQKSFIGKKFKPETMEELNDQNIKEFIDSSLKEFSEYASMFGDKPAETNNHVDNPQEQQVDEIDKIVSDIIKNPQGE